MKLNIDSAIAQRYGLAGAAVMAYLHHRYETARNPAGEFTAPAAALRKAFRIQRTTFDSWRDKMEEDGLIDTKRLPNITIYRLANKEDKHEQGGTEGEAVQPNGDER